MAKHDIVLLNTTSSGFETDLGSNVARIKGDADDLFQVNNASGVDKFAVSSTENSMIIGGDLTLTGNLSSSLNSTASFGKIVATKFVGDATQMTNTNQTSHVSSSKQLAARISGAFTAGFTTTGDISGSVTSTGSFTRVVANTYVGSGAQLFDPPSVAGEISGSGQIATQISGAFTSGFTISKTSTISGSGTSTGSFGTIVIGPTVGLQQTISDTSELTGLPSFAGFISSSAQIASDISGSFTSGMAMNNSTISGSATSTASFGRVDGIVSITGDASQVSGLAISTNSVSGSAQLAADISGSFTSGFEFDNSISGSATSTGSFSRLNFNSLSVTDVSGITNHEAGHLTGASGIADDISGSFTSGFNFAGTISASSDSTLRIQSLNLAGTSTFGSTNLVKNWDTSLVRTATFGVNLASAISGAFNHGFGFEGTISGSATSTGSFSRIQSQELFVKQMVGERKPISGSMNHDNYISASHKTDSHGRLTIPIFGRGHTVNTQQFTATGSMESQKYRARAGQLFVDNFGRLNMTVQTGSEVAVAGTWTQGPTTPMNVGGGGAAATGTPNAIIQSSPFAVYSGSAIYDGISWFQTSDVTAVAGATKQNCSIGTVDAALFLRHSGGSTSGTNTGRYGSFPTTPAHTTFQEDWDGVGWTRGPNSAGTFVKRNGTSGKVGSANSHIAFNGDDYPTAAGTSAWNGVTWQAVGPHTPTVRDDGGGFGGVYDGVVAGGKAPNNTCVDEWNGTSWATATALPTGQTCAGGAGHQNAGIIMGGSPSTEVQEYNGTTWSEGISLPVAMSNHATGGSNSGRAFSVNTNHTYFWTGGFVTGSADTYNNFSQNPTGRYLLTKKLQSNYSPGTSGGVTSGSSDGYGGGY